jgi:hypothetical protein
VVVVFGTGTVIARMAHAHLRHDGPFEACRLCHRFTWSPDSEPGALLTAGDGRVVGESEAARKLLTP